MLYLMVGLSLPDLGLWGSLSAIAMIGCAVLGLETGSLTARQAVSTSPGDFRQLGGAISAAIFINSFPLIFALFFIDIFSWTIKLSLFIIIITESFCFEMRKLLIGIGKVRQAAEADLLKSAMWVPPFVIGVEAGAIRLSLETALAAWTVGSIFAASFCHFSFYGLRPGSISIAALLRINPVNGLIILFSGLIAMATEVSPRLLVVSTGNLEGAGVITFFSGFIFSIPLLVWSSTIGVDYKVILSRSISGDIQEFRALLLQTLTRGLVITALCLVVSAIFLYAFILWDGRSILLANYGIFLIMTIIPFFYWAGTCFSIVLHFKNRDRLIAVLRTFSLILGGFVWSVGPSSLISAVVSVLVAYGAFAVGCFSYLRGIVWGPLPVR